MAKKYIRPDSKAAYLDDEGNLHWDAGVMCDELGLERTPENQDLIEATIYEQMAKMFPGIPVQTLTPDDPKNQREGVPFMQRRGLA